MVKIRRIIDRATWEQVQARLRQQAAQREQGIHARGNAHFLFGKVFCAECGAPYKRRTVSRKGEKIKIWNCAERQKGKVGNGCKNHSMTEETLLAGIARQLGLERLDEEIALCRVERVTVNGATIRVNAIQVA